MLEEKHNEEKFGMPISLPLGPRVSRFFISQRKTPEERILE